MRLHRLRLRDVKGVAERTVEFPDSGVVVIEGPNEVGKTTLLEAFDMLLDPALKATSRHRRVLAMQPVGQDVGPCVEAEFTVGSYRVRFAKQWLRGPRTELEVLSPRREQHTGEAAQQRIDAILAETLDRSLWEALRFTQASSLGQVPLTDSAVLTEALDGASGADLHATDSAPLLEQVELEWRRYFTRTGRTTGVLKAAIEAASAARDDAVHAFGRVQETEQLVERHHAARATVERLAAQLPDLEQELEHAREHAGAAVAALEGHEQARSDLARAAESLARAESDLTERQRQAGEIVDAAARLTRAEEDLAGARSELETVSERGDLLSAEVESRRGTHQRAGAVLEAASAEADHLVGRERAAVLRRRLDRLAALRADDVADKQELAALPAVDEATVRDLEQCDTTVLRLRTRLEASSAHVALEALGEGLELLVNGEPVQLAGAQPSELTVAGGLEVELPGALRLTVRPEQGMSELARQLATAERARAEALERAGVSDVAAARAAAATCAELTGRIAHRASRIADLLEGTDEEAAHREVAVLEQEAAAYSAGRPSDRPLPPDVTTARAVVRAAQRGLGEAAKELREAEEALRRQEQQGSALRLRVEKAVGANGSLAERLDRDRARLASVRAAQPDAVLEEAVAAARRVCERATSREVEARLRAEEADAAGARSSLAAAERSHRAHVASLSAAQGELAHLEGQVELVSGEGRREAYDEAVAEFVRLREELEAVHRRARAARHLHETLGRHRDLAHSAYVRPYRQELERLGRLVYGAGFEVEIAEDLTIVNRTLGGRTVSFDQLSGGAREQLGILSRLAVACLVEVGDGVPVIIDDALGYTDPERLEQVSTVFGGPGERSQVILLTCTPDRYAQIQHATTIRLSA